MNIYDRAHELAKALQNSEEYQNLLVAKKGIDGDEQARKMVKDFVTKQMEIEYEMMAGKKQDQEKTEQLQKLYTLLAYNKGAKNFLDTYLRFQRTSADVYKIIGESISEGMNFFAKE